MGAAAGFGVELDAEGGDVGVGDAFYGAVVHVEKAHFGVCWERSVFNGVAVVLACDVDTVGLGVFYGVVSAAVTVF